MGSKRSSGPVRILAPELCPQSLYSARFADTLEHQSAQVLFKSYTRKTALPRTITTPATAFAASLARERKNFLYDLPNEILLSIADLVSQRDLNALTRTSRKFHLRLDAYLYLRDVKDDGIRTCFWAIEHSYNVTVRNLLDAGLDPNARETWSYRGATPLHWAALHGESSIAALLIERGADIEVEDHRGYTPFQLAVERNRESVVWILIVNGVNGGHTNFDKFDRGCTALHVASYLGSPEIVKLLLDAGEDIEAQDSRGLTPLHWATRPSYKGWSHKRTADGVVAAMKVLLDHGANINALDEDGLRPAAYVRAHWDDELRMVFEAHDESG